MKTYARAARPALAFLAVAFLSLAPAVASAKSDTDSPEFSGFLSQARSEALQLQRSAQEMNSFAHFTANRETEAAKIGEIKQHVNKLGELIIKMNNVEAASPWQQMAI